jgi:hypothetical protein
LVIFTSPPDSTGVAVGEFAAVGDGAFTEDDSNDFVILL